ncbi:sterol desaturase family protein [Leisingera sp. ANG-M1]|uniref:sterol desaturase family protein n=1 Tax=Leisingera sp. ANG-M1 TaxID=1577895 RepID=UPI00068D70C3|nr:sterol desaturase family protein [Leisingera sp. ANG-M1]
MTTTDINASPHTERQDPGPMSREWHWHPDLPVKHAPYWHWPPKPGTLAKWLWQNWLQVSDRSIYVALAFAVSFWLQPVTTAQAGFAFDWMAWVFLRNWVLLLIVAGGLHLWFYGIDGQGKLLKYDPRPYAKRRNALYKFGYQTWDNMYYSMVFGATFLSILECVLRWIYANEYIGTLSFAAHPIWFIALFPVLAIWQSFHFYVVHLFLHQPFIYRHVHAVHHRNVNTGPWSGMSMHPVEAAGYLSAILIVLVLPSHPVHMLFLGYWLMLGAASSHSGYEAIWAKDRQALLLGAFFHQLHHRYYECNYGNAEMPWDKWFGTYHDGSEAATRRTRDRKRQMHAAGKSS